jgi:hypothetical protein
MARLLVSDRECSVDPGLTTWGDLLGHLERTLSDSGEVVTSARFDGSEEPAFRDPLLAGRPLSDVGVVEVEASSPVQLLGRTLAEARGAMPEFRVACRQLADQFRGHDIRRANQWLLEFSQGIGAILAIVRTAGHAMGTPFDTLAVGDHTAQAVLQQFGTHLAALVSAEETLDWLTVADILEYDIEPSTADLARLLDALSQVRPH